MNTCSTCAHWQPEEREQIGSTMTYRKADPLCTLIRIKGKFKVRYAEDKPLSWCHKEATPEQLASRVKAGLIGE
jgi:hypothetical protein